MSDRDLTNTLRSLGSTIKTQNEMLADIRDALLIMRGISKEHVRMFRKTESQERRIRRLEARK